MRNNYFSAAFAAKSVLDIWIDDDRRRAADGSTGHRFRKVVFINSAAAFVALPGSIAYTRERE